MTIASPQSDPAVQARLEHSTIYIVGTVRNGGRGLAKDVARLAAATAPFGARRFFISESDSDDDTLDQLRLLRSRRNDFHFESLGRLASTMPHRTQRIAAGRNQCVEFVRRQPEGPDDYVLFADLDGINNRINARSLLSCWHMGVPWDVCTANRGGPYYDIYALRCPGWIDEDWHVTRKRLGNRLDPALAAHLVTTARMIVLSSTHPPIRVESAFGGLGIYRRAVFNDLVYEGRDPDGGEICEHLSAHRQITEAGGAIYINPAMIAGGWPSFFGKRALKSVKRMLMPG